MTHKKLIIENNNEIESDEIIGFSLIFKSGRKHYRKFKKSYPVGWDSNDFHIDYHLNFVREEVVKIPIESGRGEDGMSDITLKSEMTPKGACGIAPDRGWNE